MAEKISTLRSFVCDGLMYSVVGKPEATSICQQEFADGGAYFKDLLAAHGTSERIESMLNVLATIQAKTAEIMAPDFNNNAATEDRVVMENEKSRAAQEQLLVKNLHNEFINAGSPLAIDLIPFADSQVKAFWCLNFAHPHVRIFPNKFHLAALNAMNEQELAAADPSVQLIAQIVNFGLRVLKSLQVRPVALALADSVSTGMLKYGYYWLPNLSDPQILTELKALEAKNDSLRMIGAVSSTNRLKLRPRETPILSTVAMLLTSLINEFTLGLKLSAEEGMLFQGNRLVSTRPEALNLFVARASFFCGGKPLV